MTKQEQLFEYLKVLQQMQAFSLGLHTTTGEATAKSICEIGLLIKGRPLEGTLKIRGGMDALSPKDLDFFFPYTDVTVMVAIPASFGTERIDDNLGGNNCLCEFSRYIKYGDNPMFDTDMPITSRVPPEFIIGYYDKQYGFVPNDKCKIFSSPEFVSGIEKDYQEGKPLMDMKASFLEPKDK